MEKWGSQEENSLTRVGFHRLVVGLRNDEARAERGPSMLRRVKLQSMAHRFAKISDAIFAARFDEELQLVPAEPQRLDDVLAGDEIPDQDRLLVDETKAGSPTLINLRSDRLVANAAHLHSGRYNHGDVRRRAIRGVIMKWKPPRRVHQIRAFGPNISQPFVRQRSTLRRRECPAPANAHGYWLSRRYDLPQIDAHVRPEGARAYRVLYESGQRLSVLLDVINVQ